MNAPRRLSPWRVWGIGLPLVLLLHMALLACLDIGTGAKTPVVLIHPLLSPVTLVSSAAAVSTLTAQAPSSVQTPLPTAKASTPSLTPAAADAELSSRSPVAALTAELSTHREDSGGDLLRSSVPVPLKGGHPAPEYPRLSRRLGESGEVLLQVCVNAEGGVDQLTVTRTSGFARLDTAASETVARWRFSPARQAGQAVAQCHALPVNFVLRN